jgi:putative CocE/NonD family hydrolase
MGAADQRCQEIRTDVLVYTSAILEEELQVIGDPLVTLHIATDTPSADVILRLNDVHPDGSSITVSDGVYRLRPGEAMGGMVAKLEIKMSPTAVCFRRGHRIRLTVAGSDFPARDRNPNNGTSGIDATWSDYCIATEMVFHDANHPSRIVLPLG